MYLIELMSISASLWIQAWAEQRRCQNNVTIDLSSGTINLITGNFVHDGIVYSPDQYYVEDNSVVRGCVCEVRTCVKTCCPKGQAMLGKGVCVNHDWNLKLDVYEEEELFKQNAEYFVYSVGLNCSGYSLETNVDDFDFFYVQRNGSIKSANEFTESDQYCLTTFTTKSDVPQAKVCFPYLEYDIEGYEEREDIFYAVPISLTFLIATLIVYSLLPDKSNVSTKCQMNYIFSLTMSYTFFCVIKHYNVQSKVQCDILAMTCYFCFISSFCWMNISCIDIYRTFSARSGYIHGLITRSALMKTFGTYCVYAYGFPIVPGAIILLLYNKFNINFTLFDVYEGKIHTYCWITQGISRLFHFYAPMGILIIINIVLFAITSRRIRKLDKDASMVQHGENEQHYEHDKNRFWVYLKLLIALGINWLLGFISSAYYLTDYYKWIKYISPLYDALYCIFIFYVFVSESIWIILKKRYHIFMEKLTKAKRAMSARTTDHATQTEKTSMDDTVVSFEV